MLLQVYQKVKISLKDTPLFTEPKHINYHMHSEGNASFSGL